MKKTICFLTLIITIFSCSSNNDDNNSSASSDLLGTWAKTHEIFYNPDGSIEDEYFYEFEDLLDIQENGGETWEIDTEGIEICNYIGLTLGVCGGGSYTYNNGVIEFIATEWHVQNLSESVLELKILPDEEDNEADFFFIKVSPN